MMRENYRQVRGFPRVHHTNANAFDMNAVHMVACAGITRLLSQHMSAVHGTSTKKLASRTFRTAICAPPFFTTNEKATDIKAWATSMSRIYPSIHPKYTDCGKLWYNQNGLSPWPPARIDGHGQSSKHKAIKANVSIRRFEAMDMSPLPAFSSSSSGA
mmetsp:Transcript_637/g.1798  ORF Transcript_637/g.1798 Transcript_637/m.1798 type:complete len:158 (-) Transcript_637:35-508(-)